METIAAIYRGQSLLRIRMNQALEDESISGRVVDIGGGRNPDYFAFLKQENVQRIEVVDGQISGIDFEKDALPYAGHTFDVVLLCNVLEHIYNHQFLLEEINRILAPSGKIIGFVPFWIGYHPDPHDYYRYTDEALARMLSDAGFTYVTIRPLEVGPLLANFNTIMLSLPRVLRPVAYLWYAFWNWLFLFVRPKSSKRNPLGYIFTATAHA